MSHHLDARTIVAAVRQTRRGFDVTCDLSIGYADILKLRSRVRVVRCEAYGKANLGGGAAEDSSQTWNVWKSATRDPCTEGATDTTVSI